MPTTASADLIDFLRSETRDADARARGGQAPDDATVRAHALRVPLELDGALWSAVVERIAGRSLALIVDDDALTSLDEQAECAIHYQPVNDTMRRAPGRVTASDVLAGRRVRLNFELS